MAANDDIRCIAGAFSPVAVGGGGFALDVAAAFLRFPAWSPAARAATAASVDQRSLSADGNEAVATAAAVAVAEMARAVVVFVETDAAKVAVAVVLKLEGVEVVCGGVEISP